MSRSSGQSGPAQNRRSGSIGVGSKNIAASGRESSISVGRVARQAGISQPRASTWKLHREAVKRDAVRPCRNELWQRRSEYCGGVSSGNET
eukprot:11127446-Karenia_brevis.AAC.1